MIDIESKVAETLHHDAAQPIKMDGLRERAVARAGAIRRRRRVFSTAVAGGLAALTTVGVVVAPRLVMGPTGNLARQPAPATPVKDRPAGPTSPAGPTTLPEVAGVPTAGQQPPVVGSDPAVLHFDLDLAAVKATASRWSTAKGYEKATISTRTNDWAIEIVLTPNPKLLDRVMLRPGWNQEEKDGSITGSGIAITSPTTVNGRPATLGKIIVDVLPKESYDNSFSWVLRWQPVDGLYAQVQVIKADKKLAYTTAQALRLDRAQRCVMPLRLTDVPAGVSWIGCDTEVRRRPQAGRSGVFVSSGVMFEYPDRHRVQVWFEDDRIPEHKHDRGWFQPNREIAGHPAMWMIRGDKGLAIDYGAIGAGVWPGRRSNPQDLARLTEAEATKLVAGVKLSGDLARPETWPQRPIG